MHQALKELPIVEDYGEGFRSRMVEWGGMIVSYEIFPKGTDATRLRAFASALFASTR